MSLLGSTEFDLIFKMVDEVSGKMSGISSHIDNLGKKATGTSGGPLKGLLSGLGGVATVAAGMLSAGLIQNIAGQVVGLGREALGAVVSFEQLSMSMESLVAREIKNEKGLTSMSQALSQAGPRAKELLGWIQQLAIKSPFDQEGVAIAFRTALAYGFTTEQAQKLTQVTIDYATASGQGVEVMNRITLALGQISARGKLTGGDMLQLVNAGVNVRAILEGMGYSMEDVSKGVVEADAFIQAFTKTMEEDFGGAAERSSGTWGGLLNSLGDIKKIALREFFGGIFEAVKPLVQTLTDWLMGPGLPKIKEWGGAVAEFATGAVQGITDLASDVGMLIKTFQDGGPASLGFRTALAEITGTDFAVKFHEIAKYVEDFIEVFKDLGPLGAFKKAIGDMFGGEGVSKLEEIQGVVEQVWGVISEVVGSALAVIQPAWDTFVTGIQEGFSNMQPLIDAFKQLWVDLGPFLMAVLGLIGGVIATMIGGLVAFFSGVAQAIAPFIQMIVSVVTSIVTILTGIIQVITGILQTIWGVITGNQNLIKSGTEKFKQGFLNIWNGLWTGVLAIVTGVIDTVLSFIGGFIDGMMSYWGGLMSNIAGKSTEGMTQVKNAIVGGLNTIKSTMLTWISTAASTMSQLGTRISNALKNFSWSQVGKDIVQGIANGITAGAQWAVNAIRALAQRLWNTLTGFFNSNSPSMLTFGLGEDITAGIAKGLDFSTPVAVQAATDTANAVNEPLQGMGATTTGGAGSGGGDVIFDVVINIFATQGMSELALAEQVRQKMEAFATSAARSKKAGYSYSG